MADLEDTGEKATSVIPELFYDLIAVVMPGYALLLFLYYFASDSISLKAPSAAASGVAHFAIAYLLGHVLYSFSLLTIARLTTKLFGSPKVSELYVDPKDNTISPKIFEPVTSADFRVKLRQEIAKKWGISEHADAQLCYELCRNYIAIHSKDRARFIRKEQAYGELFRSLALVGVICALLSIWFARFSPFLTFACCIAVTLAAWYRYLYSRKIDAFFNYFVFHILYMRDAEKS